MPLCCFPVPLSPKLGRGSDGGNVRILVKTSVGKLQLLKVFALVIHYSVFLAREKDINYPHFVRSDVI